MRAFDVNNVNINKLYYENIIPPVAGVTACTDKF